MPLLCTSQMGCFGKMTDRRFILLFGYEEVLFTTQCGLDGRIVRAGEEGGREGRRWSPRVWTVKGKSD